MKYKNNPLNIRHSSKFTWNGEVNHYGGFCVFMNHYYCYRAALIIFYRYMKRGICTLNDIISTWAPPSENNTKVYIAFVARHCFIDPRDNIYELEDLRIHLMDILYFMSLFEIGVDHKDEIKLHAIDSAVNNNIYLFNSKSV